MTHLIPFNRRANQTLSLANDSFFNMLDDFFSRDFMPVRSLANDTFKVDVEDTESNYKISAELPGVDKDEVKLDFAEGRLTIGVERNETVNDEGKNYIHKETRRASMSRSVYLADGVAEGIKAKLENGLLNVVVPKKENVRTACSIEVE
jgi:HSP20 family protein